jgi:O-antigen ligase
MTISTPIRRARALSGAAPRRAALRWEGLALGGMLTAFVLIDLFLRPRFVAVNVDSEATSHFVPPIVSILHLAINILIVVPPVLLAFRTRTNFRLVGTYILIALGIVFTAIISLFGAGDSHPLPYVLILLLTFSGAALFAASQYGRERGFCDFMAATAIGCGIALLLAIAFNEYDWGRLSSRAGPTYWGMVAIMCFSTSFAVRLRWLRAALILIVAISLVLTSARGAMIAVVVSASAICAITIARAPPSRRGWYVGGMIILAIALPLIGYFVANDLMVISDPRRGLASGATGRALAWAQAWNLFTSHPFFGIGYRRHEQFITVATSAHEAYLAVLAELGSVGFLLYILLIVGGALKITVEALRSRDAGSASGAAFLWSYMSIGFTENLALATGLVMPLAMIFVTARAWAGGAGKR